MANVTRIKAHDPREKHEKAPDQPKKAAGEPPQAPKKAAEEKAVPEATAETKPLKTAEKAPKPAKAEAKRAEKATRKAEKRANKKLAGKVKRFLTWPFRYVHESWLELRQVRWPSRGTAWKMVGAVLVYTALFVVIIMLLDALFTWLFNMLIG